MPWDVEIGVRVTRADLAGRYGGNPQAGIAPSAQTPNVLLYSDPEVSGRYGYDYDGWDAAGEVYLYTGDGRDGDQTWSAGNRAIRDHVLDGRALRLLVADGRVPDTNTKLHRYVGRFRVSSATPFEVRRAPDRSGEDRRVFVFRLLPVRAESPTGTRHLVPSSQLVPPEDNRARFVERSGAPPGTARRVEAMLVLRYIDHVAATGRTPAAHTLPVPGGNGVMRTDLYVREDAELIEAKASTSREDVRTALGQLYDYRRLIDPPPATLAVLLPGRPADDLVDLLHEAGIAVVHEREGGGFSRLAPDDRPARR